MRIPLFFSICFAFLFALNVPVSAQWETTSILSTNSTIRAFGVLGTRVFASEGTGVLYSDSGAYWLSIGLDVPSFEQSFTVLGNDPANALLFAGSQSGLYRSTDFGLTWLTVFLDSNFTALATSGSFIFAGLGSSIFGAPDSLNGSLFLSTDQGVAWRRVDSTVLNGFVTAIAVANATSASPTLLLADKKGGLFRSTNKGTDWNSVNAGIPDSDAIRTIAVLEPHAGSTNLFAGTNDNTSHSGLYVSHNNAVSWAPSGLTGKVYATTVNGTSLFAAVDNSIFESIDLGKSWSNITGAISGAKPITALIVADGYLYAGSFDAIWRRPISDLTIAWADDSTAISFDSLAEKTAILSDSVGQVLHRIDFINSTLSRLVVVSADFSSTGGQFSIVDRFPGVPDTVQPGGIFSVVVKFVGDSLGTVYQDTIVLSIGHALTAYQLRVMGKSFEQRRSIRATHQSDPAISNYPNPFTNSTTIAFHSAEGLATVSITNMLGQEVAQLFKGELSARTHMMAWNAENFAPGLYECIIEQHGTRQLLPLIKLR
jgi:photosystem II stability/assembly factor-like uncharacterized protein